MAIHPMLAMIAIKKVQARILGDGMKYRTPSDARTESAVEEAGSLYPLTVSHPNHWWEPMRCYPFVIEAMDQKSTTIAGMPPSRFDATVSSYLQQQKYFTTRQH